MSYSIQRWSALPLTIAICRALSLSTPRYLMEALWSYIACPREHQLSELVHGNRAAAVLVEQPKELTSVGDGNVEAEFPQELHQLVEVDQVVASSSITEYLDNVRGDGSALDHRRLDAVDDHHLLPLLPDAREVVANDRDRHRHEGEAEEDGDDRLCIGSDCTTSWALAPTDTSTARSCPGASTRTRARNHKCVRPPAVHTMARGAGVRSVKWRGEGCPRAGTHRASRARPCARSPRPRGQHSIHTVFGAHQNLAALCCRRCVAVPHRREGDHHEPHGDPHVRERPGVARRPPLLGLAALDIVQQRTEDEAGHAKDGKREDEDRCRLPDGLRDELRVLVLQ
eukprot:7388715-Prymnesium_polylepis.2